MERLAGAMAVLAIVATLLMVLAAAASVAQAARASARPARTVDCVVAACGDAEELEYTQSVVRDTFGPDVRFFVYDKCALGTLTTAGLPRLANIGREQHTFAQHVVERWDDMADVLVFTPSNIRKRPLREAVLRRGSAQFDGFECLAPFPLLYNTSTMRQWAHDHTYEGRVLDPAQPGGLQPWSEAHIGTFTEGTPLCAFGSFITTRERVHRTPRSVFARVAKELSTQEPEAGHYVERLVSMIYNRPSVQVATALESNA